MSNQFAVGEVAIVTHSRLPFLPVGTEVTILEVTNDDPKWQYRLDVIAPPPWPPSYVWSCDSHLRKRRPPQDWNQLCRLTELPQVRAKEIA